MQSFEITSIRRFAPSPDLEYRKMLPTNAVNCLSQQCTCFIMRSSGYAETVSCSLWTYTPPEGAHGLARRALQCRWGCIPTCRHSQTTQSSKIQHQSFNYQHLASVYSIAEHQRTLRRPLSHQFAPQKPTLPIQLQNSRVGIISVKRDTANVLTL